MILRQIWIERLPTLLELDLGTEEGLLKFHEGNLREKWMEYLQETARMVNALLEDV